MLISEENICNQRSICSGIESACILLKRLAFPYCYFDLISTFGCSKSDLCLIFKQVLFYVYETHQHWLDNFNKFFFGSSFLKFYADKTYVRGGAVDNCFSGFDDTVCQISCPKLKQNNSYNVLKRVHPLKFQTIALPNGLIASLQGPYEGGDTIALCFFISGKNGKSLQ